MKYLVDYKGKHFIILDGDLIDNSHDFVIGEINDDEIDEQFLREHVTTCRHYGIPPYSGKDTRLVEKIEQIEQAEQIE